MAPNFFRNALMKEGGAPDICSLKRKKPETNASSKKIISQKNSPPKVLDLHVNSIIKSLLL